MFKLMEWHLKTINRKLKEINLDIKYVVILYPDDIMKYDLNYDWYRRLEKEGIIVLDVRKMVSKELNEED